LDVRPGFSPSDIFKARGTDQFSTDACFGTAEVHMQVAVASTCTEGMFLHTSNTAESRIHCYGGYGAPENGWILRYGILGV